MAPDEQSVFLSGQNRTRYIPEPRPHWVHAADGTSYGHHGASKQLVALRPLVNPGKKAYLDAHKVFRSCGLKAFRVVAAGSRFSETMRICSRDSRVCVRVTGSSRRGIGARGQVELVEIQQLSTIGMITSWPIGFLPHRLEAAGQDLYWSYRISAVSSDPEPSSLLRVRSTFVQPEHEGVPARFVIDFASDKPGGGQPRANGHGGAGPDAKPRCGR